MSGPVATVHAGVVQSIFDHHILTLSDRGGPPPDFLFSDYSFRWSSAGETGHVVFFQSTVDGVASRRVLTDAPALAARFATRLSPRDWTEADLATVTPTTFEREFAVGDVIRETAIADGLELELEWRDLASPVFAQGPAPRIPEEDIVSVLIDAREATARLGGVAVPGRPYPNEAWVPWLGRPLSSCVVALGEILLTRP